MPRFRRADAVPSIEITPRDVEIMRQVNRHRFLRSKHITALVSGSRQQTLRRLQILFHHGYLERPPCQIDYYQRGGSKSMAYGLGNRGAAFLRSNAGIPFGRMEWSGRNRSITRLFLEHALLISDFMVALELACRQKGGLRLLLDEEIPLPANADDKRTPFHWTVTVPQFGSIGVIPDRVFTLYKDASGESILYFFEADRGTMPVKRAGLERSSFQRKLIAYEATWKQAVHRTRFGIRRVRVLTVTSSVEREKHLIEACERLDCARGMFLFATAPTLIETEDLLSLLWERPGQLESIPIL